MGKLLLSVVLLIMIVAVSYIQAVRSQAKVDTSFQLGRKSSQNVDSLINISSFQRQSVTDLKKKGPAVKTAVSRNTIDIDKRHRELLAYYKKRYDTLPSNLTEYERKVAISEIRQETASKYLITIAEFNRIRELHKLNF